MTALGAKIVAARAVGSLARRSGRGGGTSLPGKLLVRFEPGAISELACRLPQGTAVISATNGKTTTAAMAAAILGGSGVRLVHNRAGANMAGGVASTLLAAARRGGGIEGDLGLFEVDEFWLDRLTTQLRPRALLLSNLFRDQLDRNGELESIADRWSGVVKAQPSGTKLVLNADDPLIADLGRELEEVITFGIEDPSVALPEMQHASDSKHCRNCGSPYHYEAIYLGHLGRYRCPGCGRSRPVPSISAHEIRLNGIASADFILRSPEAALPVHLPLPGLYNVYNALGAAGLCLELGASLEEVVRGLESVTAAFGRAERIEIDGVELSILLIKNPAGANEVLRTLRLEAGEGEGLDLWVALNDKIADGRDVSWVWDADFELLESAVRRVFCSGTRAPEMAVRLKYAGWPAERISVRESIPDSLDDALAHGSGPLYALPTYTALLELRTMLANRGLAPDYWS